MAKGKRPAATLRRKRFLEVRAHVRGCKDPKETRERNGTCDACGFGDFKPASGEASPFRMVQTLCPHAVLVEGKCPSCGTVHDRAGWVNRKAEVA